jgi:hypothetical protein
VHEALVQQITQHITSRKSNRGAIIVTGATLTGKKVVCQRAAGYASLVPYLHVSDESMGFLQLARTIATWFQYVDDGEVRCCAEVVLQHLEKKRWSRAHDECVNLINVAIGKELRSCFVVDRIQFLDDFSLSLIRECLHGKSRRQRSFHGSSANISSHHGLDALQTENVDGRGALCFLCVHVSLYSCKSAEHIVNDVTRSHASLNIPIIKVGEVTKVELANMSYVISGVTPSQRTLEATGPASGYCVGYYAERVGVYRNMSSKLRSEGKIGMVELDNNFEYTIPLGSRRDILTLPVTRLNGEVAMRYSHVFDLLPPLFQTFCKILTVASRTTFFKLSKAIMWYVLNDLIAEGVENDVYKIVVDEMLDMNILKVVVQNDEDVLLFQCPALGDIAFDVCTDVQIKSIGSALIERLEPNLSDNYIIPFALANLHDLVGAEYNVKESLWINGYNRFLEECIRWDESAVTLWREIIVDEIRALGCSHPEVVMGADSIIRCGFTKNLMSDSIMLLKQYHSPIALGPMGLTLSVITSNVHFLSGEFHGVLEETMRQVRNDLISGCERYLIELDIVEGYLSDLGFSAEIDMLQSERNVIGEILLPVKGVKDLDHKAALLYDHFIPTFVVGRVARIHGLAEKLQEMETPCIVQQAEAPIRLAYDAMKSGTKLYCDRAQDALMILATRNWKAKPIPEYLPTYYHQTIVRIRNKVLKQLSDAELIVWKHQQTPIDLEAFLIISSLLHAAKRDH